MTPDRTDANPDENAEHGVLEESGNLDTASITILGGHIAQVNVDLLVAGDDDLDDDVIDDEIPLDEADLAALDAPRVPSSAPADDHAEIVHDPHVEQLPTGDIILEPHDAADEAPSPTDDDVHDAEIVDDDPHDLDEAETPDADHAVSDADFGDAVSTDADPNSGARDADADAEETAAVGADGSAAEDRDPEAAPDDADALTAEGDDPTGDDSLAERDPVQTDATEADLADAAGSAARAEDLADAEVVDDVELLEADAAEPVDAFDAQPLGDENVPAPPTSEPLTHAPWVPAAAAPTEGADDAAAPEPASTTPEVTASGAEPADAEHARAAATETTTAPAPAPTTRAERAATGVIGTIPLTRRSAHQADEASRAADDSARADRAHSLERVRTPAPEVALTSKRIGQIDDARESSDLLTADRLLDPRQITRPEPEGLWQQLVYSVSRHRINLGDGRRARQRKDLDRRIAAPLAGVARFVPVLSRKGGVGKTTVTSLLGMALADARDDRIIAVDANPDRGTLADRVGRPNGRTVRDLVRAHDDMAGYNDVSSIVARDATRLDVLASDSDPRVSEAFSDDDYRQVADVAAHYYSIVLTDTGTGIVHSVMGATLELADTLVIVAGLSVDEARLASETLTWLETNGYAARVRDAVVVLNNSRPGTPLVRESELEAHFRSRVRTVIRMPYDARIAAGSAITFRDLQPSTRQAARELAAAVVEGLRTPAAAA